MRSVAQFWVSISERSCCKRPWGMGIVKPTTSEVCNLDEYERGQPSWEQSTRRKVRGMQWVPQLDFIGMPRVPQFSHELRMDSS